MSKERLFGTDGVRGIPGKAPLLPDTIRDIAELAARLMLERGISMGNGRGPFIAMGRDTRGSGPAIAKSLVEGFAAAGVRTIDLGVIPTPGVSYLTPRLGALCGVVISASHNPAEFNGIKFFDAAGFKMDPASEDHIERRLTTGWLKKAPKPARPAPAKPVEDGSQYAQRYVDFLRSTFPATLDLSGMRVVVDSANGAASAFAGKLIESLGAEVICLSCDPDGKNINADCGALYPQAMQKMVVKKKADCGVCFDGDADRAIFADEKGGLMDGDAIICLSALRLRKLSLLRSDKVVLTVMSNFGFLRFLAEQGIGVVTVPVGDRNVTEAIEKDGLSLGGESSGHIIFRQFAATGDGMLTALQSLAALRESGKPLSTHRKSFHPYPQVLQNLETAAKPPLESLPGLKGLIASFEKELAGDGRVLVRYSGTEPVLRIMLEGPSQARIKEMARGIADKFLEETGQEAHAQ
jgi:phosphoglucosamine mutase